MDDEPQRRSSSPCAVGGCQSKKPRRVYKLSTDEFLAWQRNLDRYGIPGLRTTRDQIYRESERSAERVLSPARPFPRW